MSLDQVVEAVVYGQHVPEEAAAPDAAVDTGKFTVRAGIGGTRRVPTATLNRWFEQAVDANPPPAVSGRRLKLNYITQAKARPPSFILFCSRADAVPTSYLRYLTNSMREAFELPGTPIRITLREKENPFAHKRKRPS